jgi:hypothetical protein
MLASGLDSGRLLDIRLRSRFEKEPKAQFLSSVSRDIAGSLRQVEAWVQLCWMCHAASNISPFRLTKNGKGCAK